MSQPPPEKELTVEEHVLRMERELNSTPHPDEKELQRQAEQDTAEITRLGLSERAWSELATRIPGAVVNQWSIGYFGTRSTVWCDFRYTVAPSTEVQQKEFGFRQTGDDQWETIWPEPIPIDAEQTQDDGDHS